MHKSKFSRSLSLSITLSCLIGIFSQALAAYSPMNWVKGESSSLAAYVETQDLTMDVSAGQSRALTIKVMPEQLLNGKSSGTVKAEVFEWRNGIKHFVNSATKPVGSTEVEDGAILDLHLDHFYNKERDFEVVVFDTLDEAYNTYSVRVEGENLDKQPQLLTTDKLAKSDCNDAEFGECQLDYIFSNLSFLVKESEDEETEIIKTEAGAYEVVIPTKTDLNSILDGYISVDQSSGKIGIGTATPREKLEVVGNAKIGGNVIKTNGDNYFRTTDGSWGRVNTKHLDGLNKGPLYLNYYSTASVVVGGKGSSRASRLLAYGDLENKNSAGLTTNLINNDGNSYLSGGRLGILNPATDIIGTSLDQLVVGNGSGNSGIVTHSGSDLHGAYAFSEAGRVKSRMIWWGNRDTVEIENPVGKARLSVRNNGKVGIGTKSPVANLHTTGGIYGNPIARFQRTEGGNGYVDIHASHGDPQMVFNPETNLQWGIGVKENNDSKFYISFDKPGSANVGPLDHGTAAVVIDRAGKMGLGTTTPQFKLDVNGSARVSDLTAGTMSLGNGTIIDATGAINFADENLTTTGTVTATKFVGDGSGLTGITGASSNIIGENNENSGSPNVVIAGDKNTLDILGTSAVIGDNNTTVKFHGIIAGNWNKLDDTNVVSISEPTTGFIFGGSNTVAAQGINLFGDQNEITGNKNDIIGNKNKVSGWLSTVIGSKNTVTGQQTTVIGHRIKASATHSMIIGRGPDIGLPLWLENTKPDSLAIGFNSTKATLFVGPAPKTNQTGNVGIGTDEPARKLHISEAMRIQPQSTAPSNPELGDIYVNSNDAVCVYATNKWNKIAGSGSCN